MESKKTMVNMAHLRKSYKGNHSLHGYKNVEEAEDGVAKQDKEGQKELIEDAALVPV